jgi:hypothetical protein
MAVIILLMGMASAVHSAHLRPFLRLLKSKAKAIGVVALLMLGFFQVLGALRSSAGEGANLPGGSTLLDPSGLVAYFPLGLSALGPHLARVSNVPSAGALSFPFAARWTHRLGLSDRPKTVGDVFDFEYFKYNDQRISRCGVSALGLMIADFGLENLWWSYGLLVAGIQLTFLLLGGRGLVGETIAINAAFAAFYTTQAVWFLSGGMVISVIWAALMVRLLGLRRRSARRAGRLVSGRRSRARGPSV